MSALRELLARFSIEVDDHALKEGEKGITGLVEKLKHAGEVFATAFAIEKFRGFLENQIQSAAQLKVTSERLGTNTDELQAMQLAAEQAGVSAETLSTSLRFLNRSIAEASKSGSHQAKTFKDLGITLKNADGSTKSSSELMGDFADAIAKIPDPARQTQVAMQLLGRGGAQLIPLLKEGGESFRKARQQMIELGGGMSKDFVEAAHKAEAANVRLKFAMTGLKSEIASALLPAFEELVRVGTRVVVNMIDMAKHTGFVKAAFAALFVGAAIIAPEITLIAAAATGLYLVFEDLYVLFRGGDSLIGRALGPDKQKFVDNIRAAVETLGQTWSDFAGLVDEVADAVMSVDRALEPLGTVTSFRDLSRDAQELVAQIKSAVDNLRLLLDAAERMKNLDFSGALADLKNTSEGKLLTGGPSGATGFSLRKSLGLGLGEVSPHAGEDMADGSHHEQRYNAPGAGRAGRWRPAAGQHGDRAAPTHVIIVPGPLGTPTGDRAASLPSLQQTNTFNTTIQTSSDDPQGLADEAGKQSATGVQLANNRARTARNKP